MEIIIREERKADIDAVFKINSEAFERNNESRLVDSLRRNPDVFVKELSLVADLEGEVIGHILFTKIGIESDSKLQKGLLSLAPMSVLPHHQREGVGSLLVKTGIEIAKKLKYKGIIVLGHPEYYPRFGFKEAKLWDIYPPFQVNSNVFMCMELQENSLLNIRGKVVYPKEFESVD
jgi:putative acetyltransferase